MKYSLAVVSVISALSAACAVTSDPTDAVGEEGAAISKSTLRLPTKLTCELTVDGGHDTNVIYTRLESVKSASQLTATGLAVWGEGSANTESPKKDEIADGWRGDYYSADITSTEYHYNLWTCDTEDRAYTFKTDDLILPAGSTATTKNVAGRVNISVRDEGADYDLNCVAHY